MDCCRYYDCFWVSRRTRFLCYNSYFYDFVFFMTKIVTRSIARVVVSIFVLVLLLMVWVFMWYLKEMVTPRVLLSWVSCSIDTIMRWYNGEKLSIVIWLRECHLVWTGPKGLLMECIVLLSWLSCSIDTIMRWYNGEKHNVVIWLRECHLVWSGPKLSCHARMIRRH